MGEPYGRASLRPTLARTGITQFRFSMPRLGPLLLLDLSDDALLAHIYAINAQGQRRVRLATHAEDEAARTRRARVQGATESLWGSLKLARPHARQCATRCVAMDEVIDWLGFYNVRRGSRSLTWLDVAPPGTEAGRQQYAGSAQRVKAASRQPFAK